jgi:GT2 family glycosyltransferase
MFDLSVIIVSYNMRLLLDECLAALQTAVDQFTRPVQQYLHSYKIVTMGLKDAWRQK